MDIRMDVLEADCQTIGREWSYADVCSPYWRVYINQDAGAAVQWAGGVYKIVPGRVHVIPAWVRFTCRCRRRVDHCYMHVRVGGLPGEVSRRVFAQPFGLPLDEAARSLARVMREANDRPETALLRHCHAQAAAWRVIAEAFAGLSASARNECRPFLGGSPRFGALLAHIDRHLGDPLCNDELARRVHLSTGQFIRNFHAEVGQTPTAYVRERRVTAAAERLRFTDDSIDRIAADLGFTDRYYFTRVFAQVLGTPPGAYRRQRGV